MENLLQDVEKVFFKPKSDRLPELVGTGIPGCYLLKLCNLTGAVINNLESGLTASHFTILIAFSW